MGANFGFGALTVAPDDIRELFSVFGPVEVRRLFGGAGIYAGGTMFALVHRGVIYLKADERNAPAFDQEQLGPFTYSRGGEQASLASYRRMPDRLYDDPDELATWANAALAAAGRSGAGRRRPAAKAKTKTKTKNTTKAKTRTRRRPRSRKA
jgi:DNA transformation protein and related proteins